MAEGDIFYGHSFSELCEIELEDGTRQRASLVVPVGGTVTMDSPTSEIVEVDLGDGEKQRAILVATGASSSGGSGAGISFKPLTIGYAGDSIAGQWSQNNGKSAMFWYTNYINPCLVETVLDTAQGGSPSNALLEEFDSVTAQIEVLEALETKPELLVVHTTQNDWIGSATLAEWSFNNVKTYCDRALAAGVNYIIIAGRPPRTGDDDPKQMEYLNRMFHSYAMANDSIFFLDVLNLWRSKPVAAGDQDGVAIEWDSIYSADGTHPNTKAMYDLAQLLPPVMDKMVIPRYPQPTSAYEYDNDTAPYANIMGLDGLMLGTGGQYNGVADSRVAGTSDRPIKISDGNGVTATPSIVVGDDGYNYQQIELSGTATATTYITIENETATGVVDAGNFVLDFIIHVEDISGVYGVNCTIGYFDGTIVTEEHQEIVGDHRIHITNEASIEVTNYTTILQTIKVTVASGASPTGKIRLGRCGIYRQVEQE